MYFRKKKSQEEKILEEIKRCTEAVNSNAIEHTAYIRASAAKKEMDIEKYKIQVKDELQNASNAEKSKEEDEEGKSYSLIFFQDLGYISISRTIEGIQFEISNPHDSSI